MRQSPLFWPFGKAFEWGPLARLGDRLYRLIGDNRAGALGRFSGRFLPYRRQWMRLSRPEAVLVCTLAILVLAHNLTTLPKIQYQLPSALEGFQKSLRLNQTWNMFAPRPAQTDGWFVIRGVMENGTAVDLWHGTTGEPDLARPRYVSQWYPDYRWRKYMSRVPLKAYSEQLRNFARHYCRKNNARDPGEPKLAGLWIDYHRDRTMPDYQPPESKVIRLLNWNCLAKKDK
jgi:hypothetical protein